MTLLWHALWMGLILFAATANAARPKMVVIYADDLGYGDVQCYNAERGKIPTPHIDRLAAQGMRFTDGHSSSGVPALRDGQWRYIAAPGWDETTRELFRHCGSVRSTCLPMTASDQFAGVIR